VTTEEQQQPAHRRAIRPRFCRDRRYWDFLQHRRRHRRPAAQCRAHRRINANGTIEDYGRSESNYSTDVLTQKAVAFITNSAASDKPFFLFLAPFAPHAPYTPAPRHAGRYADVPPWRPPNYNEQDVSDKPTWVQKLRPASPQTQTDYDKGAASGTSR
jgi:arylsulfatase A-like enzyme